MFNMLKNGPTKEAILATYRNRPLPEIPKLDLIYDTVPSIQPKNIWGPDPKTVAPALPAKKCARFMNNPIYEPADNYTKFTKENPLYDRIGNNNNNNNTRTYAKLGKENPYALREAPQGHIYEEIKDGPYAKAGRPKPEGIYAKAGAPKGEEHIYEEIKEGPYAKLGNPKQEPIYEEIKDGPYATAGRPKAEGIYAKAEAPKPPATPAKPNREYCATIFGMMYN